MPLMARNIKLQLCCHHTILVILLLTGSMAILVWLLTHQVSEPVVVVKIEQLKTSNDLSDDRQILKTKLQALLNCRDERLTTAELQHGNYWLLKNIIRGRLSIEMGCAESITFATIGDYTFLSHLEELVIRWMGPISFALFAPGYDFNATMTGIQYIRHCLPVSRLIRDYVSFHIYFPNQHLPLEQIPRTEEEALEWPYDCFPMFAPYDHTKRSALYSTAANITFPINVGRNIAKKSVNTYFVFTCDIELYPSLRFIDKFLRMAVNNANAVLGGARPRVYAVPVFELEKNALVPDNKDELMTMYEMKMAVQLHEKNCSFCYSVAQHEQWLQAKDSDNFEVVAVAKRYSNFPFWEPFYVSDNREPEFDERFSWDERWDKRLQSYAMCLLDYEYHILHPAFLAHSPGIDRYDPLEEKVEMAAEKAMLEYWMLYGNNTQCKL